MRRDVARGPLDAGDLPAHHLHDAPVEGRLAREGLVEHHADAVHVRGRANRLAGEDLLRRHVRRRPDEAGVGGRGDAAQIGGHAEVEHDHAAGLGHEHVRGLQVAVDDPRAMERVEAAHELPHRLAQAGFVVARRPAVRRGGAHVAKEVDAVDELHREEPLSLFGEQLLEHDDVGVCHCLRMRNSRLKRTSASFWAMSRSTLSARRRPVSGSMAS